MSNKAQLRATKNRYLSIRNDKNTELKGLQDDKRRLKQAIRDAEEVENDFDTQKGKYDSIEIQNSEWKGTTRKESDNKKRDLDEAIDDYKTKYKEIIEQMNKDLEELEIKIGNVETDISNLTHRINSIDRQLASD